MNVKSLLTTGPQQLRIAATFVLVSVATVLMFFLSLAAMFQAKHFVRRVVLEPCAELALKLWGIRRVLSIESAPPPGQVVYISNHTSTLDIFLILAIRLQNIRFFLWGELRKFPPIAVIGYLLGVFWTAPQSQTERRRDIFRRAARILRESGESVFLSPEGGRVTSGNIGPFNRGAFHLCVSLGAPLVPIFIDIPRAIDPGRGLKAKPGTVTIYVKPAIDTTGWTEENVAVKKEEVRDLFIQWNIDHRQPSI